MNKRKLPGLWLMLFIALFLFMSGCGKEEAVESQDEYSVGDDSVPAIDDELGENDLITEVSRTVYNNDGEAETDAGNEDTDTDTEVVYTYAYNMELPGPTVQKYVEKLMNDDEGFMVIDENGETAELPSFEDTEGSVILARESSSEGRLFEINVSWDEDSCVITATQTDGTLPDDGSEQKEEEEEPMTMGDVVRFFYSLNPSELELDGDCMDEYKIVPSEGMVFVNDEACLKVCIYPKTDPQKTSTVATYFMTGDKAHIYRLDQDTNEVEEVDF